MSLIQKKIFRLITPKVSQIFPSIWDAKTGLKKPVKEKIAAKVTDNQKNSENEIPNALGIANQIIIPVKKPKPAHKKPIANRAAASGLSKSLMSFRFRTLSCNAAVRPVVRQVKSNRG